MWKNDYKTNVVAATNISHSLFDEKFKDRIIKEGVKTFAKGGLVTGTFDVPNTKEDPADRKDPNTG